MSILLFCNIHCRFKYFTTSVQAAGMAMEVLTEAISDIYFNL